jgi:hypothetical protein
MSDRTRIRKYWKPDGKATHADNERKIKRWMAQHALSTAPGSLTVLVHSPVHESVRAYFVRTLDGQES